MTSCIDPELVSESICFSYLGHKNASGEDSQDALGKVEWDLGRAVKGE